MAAAAASTLSAFVPRPELLQKIDQAIRSACITHEKAGKDAHWQGVFYPFLTCESCDIYYLRRPKMKGWDVKAAELKVAHVETTELSYAPGSIGECVTIPSEVSPNGSGFKSMELKYVGEDLDDLTDMMCQGGWQEITRHLK